VVRSWKARAAKPGSAWGRAGGRRATLLFAVAQLWPALRLCRRARLFQPFAPNIRAQGVIFQSQSAIARCAAPAQARPRRPTARPAWLLAPEAAHRPQWSVLASFPPTYTNNALFNPDDRRRDVYAESDVTLRLDGKLTLDISYRLYGRSSFDAFAQEQISSETFALLGARLTRNIWGWRTSISYEHRRRRLPGPPIDCRLDMAF
jgi:hypothetical protein